MKILILIALPVLFTVSCTKSASASGKPASTVWVVTRSLGDGSQRRPYVPI